NSQDRSLTFSAGFRIRGPIFFTNCRNNWPERADYVRICTEKSPMPSQYIPIIIFAVLAAAFPGVTLVIMKLIRPDSRPIGAKLKPYECGIPAESDARGRYSVR